MDPLIDSILNRERLTPGGPYVLVGFDTGASVPGLDDVQAVVSLAAVRYDTTSRNHPEGGWVCYPFEWAILEDPEDGYRSTFRAAIPVPSTDIIRQFTERTGPQVYVNEIKQDDFEGMQIVGLDGHVWARFGTDISDNYYPCCVCEWHPKATP